jgi:ABC-type transporter Mla subunit MlaD
VNVGKVRRIGFSWNEYQETTPSYVVVEFEMRNDVAPLPPGEARSEMLQSAIKRGLRARLKSQGVTGTSFLSLEYLNPADNPTAQVPWTPMHTYIPAAPGQLGELLGSIDKTLRNVGQLDFSNINRLVQGDLKSAGQLLENVNHLDFGNLGTNANSLLAESRGTVAQLQPALANIDFNALNQTLANAQRTLHDLDDVVAELKNYPPGFLFGRPPSAVKEVQPKTKK